MGHSSGAREGSKDDKNPVRPDGATGTTNARSEPANLALLTPLAAKYHKSGVASPWLEARVPDAGIRERYGVFCYDNPRGGSRGTGGGDVAG
jgi:hypothetical protein